MSQYANWTIFLFTFTRIPAECVGFIIQKELARQVVEIQGEGVAVTEEPVEPLG